MYLYMTKYSEIITLPDGNKLFIHYNKMFEGKYPVWIEYVSQTHEKKYILLNI
jgi:hypothetical protein